MLAHSVKNGQIGWQMLFSLRYSDDNKKNTFYNGILITDNGLKVTKNSMSNPPWASNLLWGIEQC